MLDAICQNCAFFFSDTGSSDWDHGVCMYDSTEFEPYIEDIIEDSDFSVCAKLYKSRRMSGETKACENFEELECDDLDEEKTEGLLERWETADLSDLVKELSSSDSKTADGALTSIISYMQLGNEMALEAFCDYYMALGAPLTLEEVHKRIRFVDLLSQRTDEETAMEAFIKELTRTPSNNMTRRLYTKIFTKLAHLPSDLIREPLLELIKEKNVSYRLKKRIEEVIEEAEYFESRYW